MKKTLSIILTCIILASFMPTPSFAEDYTGTWYGVAITAISEDLGTINSYLADMNVKIEMRINSNGTLHLSVVSPAESQSAEGSWSETSGGISITANGVTVKGHLSGGMLLVEDDTSVIYFSRTSPDTNPHPTLPLPSEYTDGTGIYSISGSTATFKKPATAFESIEIPATITVNGKTLKVIAIADNAFKGDKKLNTIRIGKHVETVGKDAFANCAKLTTVKGGANVVTIKDGAFSGCKALKTFPVMNKLQKIGANAFKGAKALAKFTLAKTVTNIGKNAFNGCAGLKAITVKTEKLTNKNVGAGTFKGINKKATFKCPKKQLKNYKTLFVKKGAPKSCKFK